MSTTDTKESRLSMVSIKIDISHVLYNVNDSVISILGNTLDFKIKGNLPFLK